MATLDLNDPADVVRLNIGDTSDIEWLSDTEIQFALDANAGNVVAATKQSAMYILARMAFSGRERLDKLEFYGSEVYNNYLKFLKEVINNATLNASAGVYVGGMNLADVQANLQDSTLVQKRIINYPAGSYDDSDLNLYRVPDVEKDGYDYFSNY